MDGAFSRARAADVVVIGGGIVGVAAATHLAESGRRVTLVERTALGAGASGRNSGVVQHPFDPVLIALHLETLDLYRALVDDGMELGVAPAGLLSVTLDPAVAKEQTVALRASHPTLDPHLPRPQRGEHGRTCVVPRGGGLPTRDGVPGRADGRGPRVRASC